MQEWWTFILTYYICQVIFRYGWQLKKSHSWRHCDNFSSNVVAIRGVDPGEVTGSGPPELCRRGQSMFWPHPIKMSYSFIQNCCCITLQVSQHQGWTVGHYHFTDLAYADGAAVLMSDQLQVDSVLQSFNANLPWPKTKFQNVGAGDPPSTILIDGVPVYLGSKQSSNGYCWPDVLCRIGLGCAVMNSLQRVWKCSSVSINTKYKHLYQALVMSVLLYGAETWTLLVTNMNTLEAIHMRCRQQVLDVRWGLCLQCRGTSAIWFVNHWWHHT